MPADGTRNGGPGDQFVADELFDADYLAFYGNELNNAINDEEAQTIRELLQIEPGLRLLDLPCGYGRMARRLAQAGATVTGIDRSEFFIEHARADAARHGVSVDYRTGDMRTISFDGEFDVVLNWFTSFGYFDDDTLKTLLTRLHRALVPGGRLVIETMNLHKFHLHPYESSHTKEITDEDGTHFLIDRSRYDPHDGRLHVRRFITRSGQRTRELAYSLRLFTYPELRGWLRAAGFDYCQAFGPDCEAFEVDSDRLIVIAQRS